MNSKDQSALDILKDLGERPAAPFHEEPVATYIFSRLADLGLSPLRDEFGNVIVHYSNSDADDPPIAFVAHMDHPGFEVDGVDEVGPVGVALGGVPEVSLSNPAEVLALMPDGRRVRGRTAELDVESRRVRFDLDEAVEIVPPVPVVFDLPDFELDGNFIRMRAADDLAGCAAALSAIERLVAVGAEASVYGVFTRAEEGGLFGARLMAEARTLPMETFVVSIESSPLIPGIEQGGGPVIRTGDALFTFDADAEQVMIVARESIRARNPDFKSQRQLMSGGVCEGTAFAVWGYRATGMAFPLGNYHNATTGIRDPNSGIGAEFIRVEDFLGGVELLAEAAVSVSKRHDSPARERVREVPADVRARMTRPTT
ncbi:MAG: M20/M25/M40 family metallo-hydrolase [Dehalococcoidia bacterium]|nr:M20/M25/M40 family metallo-hydrolase [Dehalococcoidia bacterium]